MHSPVPDRRRWLRRRLYLARALLVAVVATLAAVWWWLPVPAETRIAARYGFFIALGVLVTTLSVRDEVRYREWRDRRRLGT
jgi:membrane protein YdbS with pleckstrin-like domain